MIDYQDLLRRLSVFTVRAPGSRYGYVQPRIVLEAADAMEALLKEREEMRAELDAFRFTAGVPRRVRDIE